MSRLPGSIRSLAFTQFAFGRWTMSDRLLSESDPIVFKAVKRRYAS
ncbi:hypothetical protein CHELA1G11_10076 [Hyphomicrobiales bacterium]|nr:hypothetical protein CHELA1G11_10076 [Hyphomicrobiales bacterium]